MLISKSILNLLRDDNMRREFSRESVAIAQNFNIDKILPKFEKLFAGENLP